MVLFSFPLGKRARARAKFKLAGVERARAAPKIADARHVTTRLRRARSATFASERPERVEVVAFLVAICFVRDCARVGVRALARARSKKNRSSRFRFAI